MRKVDRQVTLPNQQRVRFPVHQADTIDDVLRLVRGQPQRVVDHFNLGYAIHQQAEMRVKLADTPPLRGDPTHYPVSINVLRDTSEGE